MARKPKAAAAPLVALPEAAPPAFPWSVLGEIETGLTEIEGLNKLLTIVAGSCHEIEGGALYPIAHALRASTAKITSAWEAAWEASRAAGPAK